MCRSECHVNGIEGAHVVRQIRLQRVLSCQMRANALSNQAASSNVASAEGKLKDHIFASELLVN